MEDVLGTPEDGETRIKVLRSAKRLPEKNEIIITEDGFILIDKDNPLSDVFGFDQVGAEILCG